MIAGIDWVVQHRSDNGLNIKVLNLSFGTLSGQPYTVDPLAFAAEVAWRRGVVVVAAAGNDGSAVKQLADPAYDPRLLAVGGYDAKNSKDPKKWVPADFTNGGSSKRGADVFAPGTHLLSLRVPGSFVDSNYPESEVGTRFTRGSGTSQAAAVTSGLVADLFDKYPNATPDQIKMILVETRNDFGGKTLLGLLGLDKDDTGTLNGAKAMTKSLSSNSNGRQDFAYADRSRIARDRPAAVCTCRTARPSSPASRTSSATRGTRTAWATASMAGTSWQGGLWNGQPLERRRTGQGSGGRTPPGRATTGPDSGGAASGGRASPGTGSGGAGSAGAMPDGPASAGAATTGPGSGGAASSGRRPPGSSRFCPSPARPPGR